MKRREITTNDLELIFSNLIEQAPLLTEDQLVVLLNGIPTVSSDRSLKRFLKNHLNALILSSVLLVLATASVWWINADRKTNQAIVLVNQQERKAISVSDGTLEVRTTNSIPAKKLRNSIPEKSDLKVLSTNTSTSNLTDSISVSDFRKYFDKKPQLFIIRGDRDTTLKCNEGTSLKIKANSFVNTKTGSEVVGNIQLAVKEYYKLSDILLANLSTTSGAKILETGGMLHISAISDQDSCSVKSGSSLEIGFPYSKKKEGMSLFYGDWMDGVINWKSATEATDSTVIHVVISTVEAYSVVEEMPEFRGGNSELKRYIQKNVKYPFTALNDKLEGTVFVRFVIDRFGSVNEIRVSRGLGNILDNAAAYFVSQMPGWKPGKQNGQSVSVSYTIPVKFTIKNADMTEDGVRKSRAYEDKMKELKYDEFTDCFMVNKGDLADKFNEKVKNDNLHEADMLDFNRYLLSVSQLGWINCDRFTSVNNPQTSFSIKIDDKHQPIAYMVFQRFKAILAGGVNDGRISFTNVPKGEKVFIVAIKTLNDKIFLAFKETVISDNGESDLDYQPVTFLLLKEKMKKLDAL